MKKKLTQALVKYFVEDYNTEMERQYKLDQISRAQFHQMMSEAERVSICYWNYCCYGLYRMCWFDEYTNGIWYMTEDEVKEMTASVFEEHVDEFNKEGRIAFCEDEYGIHIVMIARDRKKQKLDIFIDFWKGEKNV